VERDVDLGGLTTGFLTGLREGVEAALIVSIVLAYLARTGNARHFSKIWLGTGAALLASAAIGLALFVTVRGFEEPYEQIFEGATMLLAAAVVTWMLFWMRRQAASVKGDLQAAVDRVLTQGTVWGLAVLAFVAIIREGVETSLFLVGQVNAAASAQGGAISVLTGAVLGLAVAAVLGYGFYHGSRRLDLRAFFRWTGIALVFIAAGLLSHAVHEFIEVTEAQGIAVIGAQTAFDISAFMPHDLAPGQPLTPLAVVGQLLRALFGYTATPEWLTLVVHVAYVVIVLSLYLRPVQPRPTPSPRTELSAPQP
jgi:high-affinity iron transporter